MFDQKMNFVSKLIDQILARYVTQRNIAVISTKEEELAMLSEVNAILIL